MRARAIDSGRSRRLAALVVGTAAALLGCGPDSAPAPESPLAGSWIRVYPPDRALDTLVLHPAGQVDGSVRGFDSLGFPLTHWRIGSPVSPGALCVGDGKRQQVCQSFVLTADTLWLANGRRSVYLRVPADGHHTEFRVWQSPKGVAVPAAPGESAPAPPAGFTRKRAT